MWSNKMTEDYDVFELDPNGCFVLCRFCPHGKRVRRNGDDGEHLMLKCRRPFNEDTWGTHKTSVTHFQKRVENTLPSKCKLGNCENVGREDDLFTCDMCTNKVHKPCTTSFFASMNLENLNVCGVQCFREKTHGDLSHLDDTSSTTSKKESTQVVKIPPTPVAASPKPTVAASPKRHFWHNDGPNENINSSSILIDWLSIPSNYLQWKDGYKNQLAGEILLKIKEAGILTERNAKNVVNKVGNLEQTFRQTVYLLNAAGSGPENEALRVSAKARCPFYEKLILSMGSNTPVDDHQTMGKEEVADNEEVVDDEETADEETADEDMAGENDVELLESQADPIISSLSENGGTTPKSVVIVSPIRKRFQRTSSSLSYPSSNKKSRRNSSSNHDVDTDFLLLKQEQWAFEKQHREMEMQARNEENRLTEKYRAQEVHLKELELESKKLEREQYSLYKQKELYLQELQVQSKQKEIESKRLMDETLRMKLMEEIEMAKMLRNAALLRERKTLLENGISSDEIDALLPLPSST